MQRSVSAQEVRHTKLTATGSHKRSSSGRQRPITRSQLENKPLPPPPAAGPTGPAVTRLLIRPAASHLQPLDLSQLGREPLPQTLLQAPQTPQEPAAAVAQAPRPTGQSDFFAQAGIHGPGTAAPGSSPTLTSPTSVDTSDAGGPSASPYILGSPLRLSYFAPQQAPVGGQYAAAAGVPGVPSAFAAPPAPGAPTAGGHPATALNLQPPVLQPPDLQPAGLASPSTAMLIEHEQKVLQHLRGTHADAADLGPPPLTPTETRTPPLRSVSDGRLARERLVAQRKLSDTRTLTADGDAIGDAAGTAASVPNWPGGVHPPTMAHAKSTSRSTRFASTSSAGRSTVHTASPIDLPEDPVDNLTGAQMAAVFPNGCGPDFAATEKGDGFARGRRYFSWLDSLSIYWSVFTCSSDFDRSRTADAIADNQLRAANRRRKKAGRAHRASADCASVDPGDEPGGRP